MSGRNHLRELLRARRRRRRAGFPAASHFYLHCAGDHKIGLEGFEVCTDSGLDKGVPMVRGVHGSAEALENDRDEALVSRVGATRQIIEACVEGRP